MLDPMYEYDRIMFVKERDGNEAARVFARSMIKIYLATLKSFRVRFKTRAGMRYQYIRSAYSARHILRMRLIC